MKFKIPNNIIKKIACIAITLCLVFSFTITAFAEGNVYYNNYATKLSELGVFKGTGNGFELDREPTRLEGLIMLIRLLGKETEALQLSKEPCAFTDVPDWGRGYVNYAYKNGLTKGISKNLFGSQDKMDGKSYMTFLLRSLGYDDSISTKDFTWAGSIEYAKSVGLLDEDLYFKIVSNTFIRDYVAKSSYNALQHNLKGASSTLIQKLVSNGAITQKQADSLNSLNSPATGDAPLTSVEIGKLADAAVLINAVGYDGSEWSGSGFYVSQDGNLVTNYHVVEGAKTLKITENDGQVYSGNIRIIGFDADKDIAVLDIDKTVKLYLKTGNSDNVVLGEEIYTIGSPYGLKNTISNGIISSLKDNGIIQISAPISHGSSGGVLLNNKGLAIGITYAGIEQGENLGFAIPINMYLNMPKNLNLDLASFYNMVAKVSKPENVKLDMLDSGTITVYWDKVAEADYYKVYVSDSPNGPFDTLKDKDGLDEWTWSSDYCVSISGIKAGVTYYVKVTAVKGATESEPSDVKTITVGGSPEDYQSSLLRTYGSLSSGSYKTYFKEINVHNDSTEDTVYVTFYLDNDYLNPFLSMMLYNQDDVESKLALIADDIAKHYNKNAALSVIYSGIYTFYPSAFASNDLYQDTIKYDSKTNEWYVFYPYVQVFVNNADDTYTAKWAY